MKKKAVTTLLALALTISLLTGCGTKTEATDIAIEEETIIVSEEDIATDVVDTDDEILATEVIGEDADVVEDFTGAEDENIVLYAEIAEYGERAVDIFDYVEQPGTINATENIPVYNVEGIEVGYIKAGASIFIPEGAEVGGIARFENPIAGTDYDYLYVLKEYVTDANEIRLTAETMKQGIIDRVLNSSAAADVDYTFLDEKESDMEVYECNLQSVYSDELDYDYWISEELTRAFDIFDYQTLCVECEEDVDGWITCRVYYKDEIDWNKFY